MDFLTSSRNVLWLYSPFVSKEILYYFYFLHLFAFKYIKIEVCFIYKYEYRYAKNIAHYN